MAAIDFPSSPVDGQSFVAPNGITYFYKATPGLWYAPTATPSGPAGGDLAGSYPNPTLAWITRSAGDTLAILNSITLAAASDGLTLNIGPGGTLGSAAFTASTAYLAAAAAAGGDLAGNYPNPTLAWITRTAGKTLVVNSSLTLVGVDGTTMTFPPASCDVGYLEIPQNIQAGNYTLVLADSGKHIYHANAAAAATYTIPANASVAFILGAAITIVNRSANNVTIAITTDTLTWSPSGGTGSRTLAQYGVATIMKITATEWIISGTGLT